MAEENDWTETHEDEDFVAQFVGTDLYGDEFDFDAESSYPATPPPEPRPAVTVVGYDPEWPHQFRQISEKLKHYLDYCNVEYLTIEHVGSTAVPGLAAKANIDIIIEVSGQHHVEAAKEALTHEPPADEHYKCIGDGGIRGRISLKLHDRSKIPDQSVYILNTETLNRRLIARCHRALRDTLRMPEYEYLKEEYGRIKTDLAESAQNGVEYGQKKNPIIRRILKAAGWAEEEIDEKEGLDYRIPGGDFDL